MDELRDFKVEGPEFNENLNLESYLSWFQWMKRIFELKKYNDEKDFKLTIFKMKG